MQNEHSPGGKLGVQRAKVCIQRRFAGSVDSLSRSRHLQAVVLFAAKPPNLQYSYCKDCLFYCSFHITDQKMRGKLRSPYLQRAIKGPPDHTPLLMDPES